jgi:hypothetical protein
MRSEAGYGPMEGKVVDGMARAGRCQIDESSSDGCNH